MPVKKDAVMQTPEEHRLEEELRVCDPDKVGRKYSVTRSRAGRMAKELYEGFETLKKYRLGATFFGSARCSQKDAIYKTAEALAGKLAQSGFAIVTGGGGGIMEAANRGAFKAGGKSVGLNINLPIEQHLNEFTTENKTFNYFFTRKVMLTFASEVYLYFPGGFGTLDEFLEILTLVQTRKIKRVPLILYGKDYWQAIANLFEKQLFEGFQVIDREDLALFTIVDSVEEAYDEVLKQVKC